jgi:hypothetical protein
MGMEKNTMSAFQGIEAQISTCTMLSYTMPVQGRSEGTAGNKIVIHKDEHPSPSPISIKTKHPSISCIRSSTVYWISKRIHVSRK